MATVSGTTGEDVLVGTPENDALLGRRGADLLTGGPGADRFVLQDAGSTGLDSTLAATDRITDFNPAEGDLLVLRGQAAGGLFQPIASRSFASPGGTLRPVGFGGALAGAAAPLAGLALPDPADGHAWVLWWLPALGGDGGWLLLDADRDGTLSGSDLVVRVDLPAGGAVGPEHFVPGTFALLGTGGQDAITGTGGDDSIQGFGAADALAGEAGNDTLEGGGGGDALSGGAGFDTLRGAAGDDTLSGGTETDVLDGGDGQDRLDGGDAADLLRGGDAADLLLGGAGDDTLEGGPGADTLVGGAGADRFILHGAGPALWSSLAAMDFVADFSAAEGDRLFLGTPFGGRADGSFATAGAFAGADGVARPLVFNGSLAPRAGVADGMALPWRPLGGLDAHQVWWVPALEGAAPAGGWLVLDLGRDGRLGGSDLVARIGSADAPATITESDFAPGTFLSLGLSSGGGFVRAGTAGDDSLTGGTLGETFLGSGGSDRIAGGIGAPNGVSYAALAGPVALRATGHGIWSAGKPDGADALAGIHAIAGTSGADTLDGSGAGQGLFAISLEGRAGADTIIGSGVAVQASYGGSPGAVVVDLVLGTAEDGWGSTDTLVGVRRIAATSGFADTVLGSFGDDVFLTGSAGNKTLDGRGGQDEYRYAGTGNVTIVLGGTRAGGIIQGPYALKPGGTDRLAGFEVVAGGGGDDSILGSAAEERLAGGVGQDTLDGGGGHDIVWYDHLSAGAALPSRGVVLDLTAGTATDPWGNTDTLRNIESAWGTQLGDDLTGRAVAGLRTWLRGLAGDDTLRGPVGALVGADHAADARGIVADLAGGTVADGWGGADTLVLINHLRGSASADRVAGNAAANWLEGGEGDDTLDGGAGPDTLTGGLGDDTYRVDSAHDRVAENANQGTDTVIATVGFSLTANIETMILAAGAGAIYGVGNGHGNLMRGNESANRLVGHDGNDTVDGGAGNDALYGVNGDDLLSGGTGIDLVFGGAGRDTLHGEDGNDRLYGEADDDLLSGGAGTDHLQGGLGDDRLEGDDAVDRLYGEAGRDLLLGGAATDYLHGGNDDDTLDGGDMADALYGQDGDDLLHGGGGFFTDILVGGNGDDTLDGSARPGTGPRDLGDYDRLHGGPGDDTYLVDTRADLAFEGADSGTDTVLADIARTGYYLYAHVENLVLLGVTPFGVGNVLDNSLTGSPSANTLVGGAGRDTLEGGAGNDVLWGQAGADTFILQRGTGIDRVADFQPGADRLRLVGLGPMGFADILAVIVQNGASCVIDLGHGDRLILTSLAKTALSASDFLFG